MLNTAVVSLYSLTSVIQWHLLAQLLPQLFIIVSSSFGLTLCSGMVQNTFPTAQFLLTTGMLSTTDGVTLVTQMEFLPMVNSLQYQETSGKYAMHHLLILYHKAG